MLLVVGTIGCGSSNESVYDTNTSRSTVETAEEFGFSNDLKSEIAVEESVEGTANDMDASQETEEVASNRKLIKTINMNLETLEYDVFTIKLEELIDVSGGYIEYLDQSNRSYYGSEDEGRNASYTIRIPVKQLDGFVDQVGEMANVRYKNEQVTDITLSYVDMESKKEMYEIEQENLMELLDRAETVEDMITIESRLTEIRYQLQSMESQLRTYDNLVDYATISIYVNEVVRLEPSVEASAGERIRTGFQNSLSKTLENLQEFGIRVIIASPVIILNLLILAIFALIVLVIIKTSIKKSEKKRKKKLQTMQNHSVNPTVKAKDENKVNEEAKK
jgi:hypothetical protein